MLKLNYVIFQDNLQAHSDQLQKFSSWHIQVSIMFEMKYVMYIDIEMEHSAILLQQPFKVRTWFQLNELFQRCVGKNSLGEAELTTRVYTTSKIFLTFLLCTLLFQCQSLCRQENQNMR